MRILVVGSGAREHALAWKLGQSPRVSQVFVAPGNAGTADTATNLPIDPADIEALAGAAHQHNIDLTVVGPEDPLARGIADHFEGRGLAIFGPSSAAAQIESSKTWAKEIMREAGVPTADSQRFAELAPALEAVSQREPPIVIKASGLAAGKGVVIAETRPQAEQAVRSMLEAGSFGDAGSEILLEEFLRGSEASVLAITDGETIYPLLTARDYKRIGEGDSGANTGGMGAYAPVPEIDDDLMDRITREILQPTIGALRERGIVYRGVLYAGLMLTAEGPKVIEYNCRLGDPETQVVLPLLESDLAELMLAAACSRLSEVAPPRWATGACVGVVLASGGYPEGYSRGYPVGGLNTLPAETMVFHAGTVADASGRTVTSGGRVLTVVAMGSDLTAARDRAYAAVSRISFENQYYRRDIAAHGRSHG